MADATPLLAMRGICKRFGSVAANRDVDLTLYPGDVLGLLGENGAGKTTLMNILFGTYSADAGSIEVAGAPAVIHNSADALRLGIGMVHQHFHLVPPHTVLENLMVGRRGHWGRLDRASARSRLEEIGRHYRLRLEPDSRVAELTIGEQQRLEIIKALFRGARILILDEPTAALTPQESEGLFEALRAMAAEGMGVIFISHKLAEVRAVTNRIVVMRQGRVAAALPHGAVVSEAELAQLMCGHALTPPSKPPMATGEALLRLEKVCTAGGGRGRLKDVSLTLRAGEILGIAGVSGNGQRDLAELVAGMRAPAAGSLEVAGVAVTRPDARRMQALGVGRIPEDRMGTGLITTLPLSDNMVLPRVRQPPFSRHGLLDRKAIRRFVEAQIESFDIRAADAGARTGTLSGGNLQKVLLARELAGRPKVLLAAQPTRGLDVAAAAFVHRQFLELRAHGGGILLISEDLEELFALADRIAVMYEGRIVGEMPAGEATVQKVGLLMAGAAETAA